MALLLTLCVWFSLQIHGLAKTGSFWHVTDFHYDLSYHTTGDSCKNRTDTTKLGRYGNYMCDSPWLLINESVHAMKQIDPDVDFIIWTGDDTPHVDNSKLSEQIVVDIVLNLTQLLNEVFPSTQVFAALGNHDYHPKNQMPPSSNFLYDAVWRKWQLWVNNSEANETFLKGGYYTTLFKPGLRIVALNTVFYYKTNKVTQNMEDPANQFQWFDDVMANASTSNEKVFVISHIPPGFFEKHRSWYWMPTQHNKRLIELILKHARTISGIFFGHHHTDTLRVFYDKNGTPVASGFIAPSVTPWKTTLPDLIGVGANNPSIRLIKYDSETSAILDIWQYFFNLDKKLANGNSADWELEYKATLAYDIPDISTTSIHKVVESFKKKNDVNFRKYLDFNSASYKLGEPCDITCKAAHFCSITKSDHGEYNTCFKEMTDEPTGGTSSRGNFYVCFVAIVCFVWVM